MSGGHFDYIQFRFEEIADEIDRLITTNENFSPETLEKFREAAYNVRRAAEMANRVDWLACGDDGEKSFHERWKKQVREPYEQSR